MDLLNILLIPIITGIIILIIEYAIVQPIKESSSAIEALSLILKIFIILITATLISINLLLLISNNLITTILSNYPLIVQSNLFNIISDKNTSLASIIYSSIALLLVSQKNKPIFDLISNFIPSTLLTIWLMIFIVNENFIMINIVILLSYLWTLGRARVTNPYIALILVVIAQPIYLEYLISSKYISPDIMAAISILLWSSLSPLSKFLRFDSKQKITTVNENKLFKLGAILIICCWPINSLILINYQPIPDLWPWIAAAGLGIIHLTISSISID